MLVCRPLRSFLSVKAISLGFVLSILTAAPSQLHASSVTYNLLLTDSTNPLYSGTGSITLNVIPTMLLPTNYAGNVTALNFVIDSVPFNLTDPGAVLSNVEFSQLTPSVVFRDINFTDSSGTLALASNGTYTVTYAAHSSTTGTFAVVANPVPNGLAAPEPSSLLLLGTGMLGFGGNLVRRYKVART